MWKEWREKYLGLGDWRGNVVDIDKKFGGEDIDSRVISVLV